MQRTDELHATELQLLTLAQLSLTVLPYKPFSNPTKELVMLLANCIKLFTLWLDACRATRSGLHPSARHRHPGGRCIKAIAAPKT